MEFEILELREVAFWLASPVFLIAFVGLYRIDVTGVTAGGSTSISKHQQIITTEIVYERISEAKSIVASIWSLPIFLFDPLISNY